MLKLSDVNKTFYAKTGLVKIFVSRNIVYVIIRAEEGILGLCERSIARAINGYAFRVRSPPFLLCHSFVCSEGLNLNFFSYQLDIFQHSSVFQCAWHNIILLPCFLVKNNIQNIIASRIAPGIVDTLHLL